MTGCASCEHFSFLRSPAASPGAAAVARGRVRRAPRTARLPVTGADLLQQAIWLQRAPPRCLCRVHAFPPRRWPAARTHEDVARRVLDLELVGPRLAHLCWPPGRLLELGPHHLEGHKAPLLLRRRRRGAVGRRQPAPLRHRLHRAKLCKQPGERSQAQRTASVTRVATASHSTRLPALCACRALRRVPSLYGRTSLPPSAGAAPKNSASIPRLRLTLPRQDAAPRRQWSLTISLAGSSS